MIGPVRFARLVRRLAQIGGLSMQTAGRMAVILLTSRRPVRSPRLAGELVRLIERLGGAFIKAGQIVGTHVDLVGQTTASELSRLHDHVAPMTAEEAIGTVRRALGHLPDGLAEALMGRRRPAARSRRSIRRSWPAGRSRSRCAAPTSAELSPLTWPSLDG